MNKTPIIIASTVALIAVGGFAFAQQTQGTLLNESTAEVAQNGDAPMLESTMKHDRHGDCDRRGRGEHRHGHDHDDRDDDRYDNSQDDAQESQNQDEGNALAPDSSEQAG